MMNKINTAGTLCYVDGNRAYFTTQPLDQQWGDDWDDAPYEHNAGTPYTPCWHCEPEHRNDPNAQRGYRPGTQERYAAGEMCRCPSCVRDWNADGSPKWEVFFVFFDGPFETPADRSNGGNSAWSVKAINSGQVAWLLPTMWPKDRKEYAISAGTPYREFCELIERAGGFVYERRIQPAIPATAADVINEVRSALMLMDGLAEQWGDIELFRRCRDRLRKLVEG